MQQLLTCTTHDRLCTEHTAAKIDLNWIVTAQHNSLPFKLKLCYHISPKELLRYHHPNTHNHSATCIVEVQHHALVCTRIQRLVKPTCRTSTAARVDRAAHANSHTLQISSPKYAQTTALYLHCQGTTPCTCLHRSTVVGITNRPVTRTAKSWSCCTCKIDPNCSGDKPIVFKFKKHLTMKAN